MAIIMLRESRISKALTVIKRGPPFDYSSTQFDIKDACPITLAKILGMQKYILVSDLAGHGRETEPHVTVKYGLHTRVPEEVEQLVRSFPPVTIRLGLTSVFQNPGKDYDVVKIDVDSPDLMRLNRLLSKLPHTDSFPVYRPHITLAYVKPGLGTRHTGLLDVNGMTLTCSKLTFSDPDGSKTMIELQGVGRIPSRLVRKGEWTGKPCKPGISAARTGCIPKNPGVSGGRREPITAPEPAQVPVPTESKYIPQAPTFVSPAHEEVYKRTVASLESAPDLNASQKQHYHDTVVRSLSSLPVPALEALQKGSKGFSFHASGNGVAIASAESEIKSHREFSEARRNDAKKWWNKILGQSRSLDLYADIADRMASLAETKKGRAVAGAFSPFDGRLYLDGEEDQGAINPDDPAEYKISKEDYSHHVYLHEMAHAVDKGAGGISEKSDWKKAWESEIKGGSLTRYAGTDSGEGFAEFARVLYSKAVLLDELEKHFPGVSNVFKRYKLWPS